MIEIREIQTLLCLILVILPPEKEVWGKVKFSEACVGHSVRGGGGICGRGCVCGIGGMCGGGGGVCGRGVCMVGSMRAGETATEASGIYPTGMHSSCFKF